MAFICPTGSFASRTQTICLTMTELAHSVLKAAPRPCGICQTESSKYVCPRCNLPYCSLGCYKSTNHVACTEEFYKSNVLSELASQKNTEDSAQKMRQILKRFEQSQEDDPLWSDASFLAGKVDDGDDNDDNDDDEADGDDYDSEDLSSRFREIDLDNASVEVILGQLTDSEKQDFQRFMEDSAALNHHSENTSKLLGGSAPSTRAALIETPWWIFAPAKGSLITEVSPPSKHGEESILGDAAASNSPPPSLQRPTMMQSIARFSEITKVAPNERVYYNLVDYLFAYCLTWRHMNGDLELPESLYMLVDVSPVMSMKQKGAYESVKEAIVYILSQAYENPRRPYRSIINSASSLLADVAAVLASKQSVLLALSHIHHLIEAEVGHQRLNPEQGLSSAGLPKAVVTPAGRLGRQRLLPMQKKIYFYICLIGDAAVTNEAHLEILKTSVEIEARLMVEREAETKPEGQIQLFHGRESLQ
ncbi:uncharacterized protein BJ171DRAFT_500658 [Polychytrium aggregatum]|uniref:uncharacterized protein n=1 Tax=Polychytrium aggregatum TaxID=110093 RepID=UPI0022FDC72E|nr:uncharacterized protein BJ171DRAFT_500658 [Polychytrium aggregatum]KAI9205508.1 hypothetical protein BJ171DRAFT_500658 [Polychytrium aggregatum]